MRTLVIPLPALALLAACSGGFDPALEDDDPLVAGAGALAQGVAVEGRWMPPEDTIALGDQQDVEYDPSGPWNDGAGCAPGMLPGTIQLRDELYAYFPQILTIGGYNCRPIVGSPNTLSQHGTGRALDIMLPLDGGQADNTVGDPIANWLVENAEALGVQAVIYDRTIWKVNRDPRAYYYGGQHPHHDHIHVELNVDGGNRVPSWYDAPFGPEPCGLVPPAETILDEDHDCFAIYGPAQYWRSQEGEGHGGGLLWTNAFSGANASNWARWSLELEVGGSYEVSVFIDDTWGVYDATRYLVRAGGAEHTVVLDQGAASGWTSLGTFNFAAGGGQSVAVYDNYAGTVASDQHIVVDALRLTPIAPEICQALPASGGVVSEDGPCFAKHGPDQYWRREAGLGLNGLWWTNAFENDAPSNWAEWSLPASAGAYEVQVYVDPVVAVFNAVRYEVDTLHGTEVVFLDQSAASGWTSLGEFDLTAASALRVFDFHSADPGDDQHIVVDSVRLVAAEVEPEPEPEPTPEPEPEEPAPAPQPEPTPPELPEDVDDDPLPPGTLTPNADFTTTEGCAAVGADPAALLLLLGLSPLARRRRRRTLRA